MNEEGEYYEKKEKTYNICNFGFMLTVHMFSMREAGEKTGRDEERNKGS